jgi:hypothetical protein
MADDQVQPLGSRAEHQIYTRRFLAIYDPIILGFYLRWVWRCPREVLAARYRLQTGARHLDVGPGTGYFLDTADLHESTAITLLDPNPEVLAHAAQRLDRHAPATVRANACEPLPIVGPFESAALNLVLHCIEGEERKSAALRHVAATLDEDSRLGRMALVALNRRGIFSNLADTEAGLRDMLVEVFDDVILERIGAVAVFTARHPKRQVLSS